MKTKIVLAVVALGFAAVVALRVRAALHSKSPEVAAAPALIGAARVVRADLPVAVRMTGTIRPRNEVDVFPKVSGRIESIHAQVGQAVRAGQLLATVEHKEIAWQAKAADAALGVARANLRGAELDYRRTKEIFDGGAAPASQLDGAKVKLELAQAQVAQAEASSGLARQQLANARIEAPFTGTVIRRPVNVGAQVGPQTPLFAIQDVASLKLESAVDAASFARLEKGQAAEVTIDGLPGAFTGKVSVLSPALDAQSRRAAVEVEIENTDGKLLPNMFARVQVRVSPLSGVVVVPREAVVESNGGAVVYRVVGDRVEAVTPTIGEGNERQVAVFCAKEDARTCLNEGDLIAVSGLSSLSAGAQVRVAASGTERADLGNGKPVGE